jgi:hypothetical protein
MKNLTLLALACLLCMLITLIGCKMKGEAPSGDDVQTSAPAETRSPAAVLPPATEHAPVPKGAPLPRSAPSSSQRKRPFTSTTGPRREGEPHNQ